MARRLVWMVITATNFLIEAQRSAVQAKASLRRATVVLDVQLQRKLDSRLRRAWSAVFAIAVTAWRAKGLLQLFWVL